MVRCSMVDRHWLPDFTLAIVLALPLLGVAGAGATAQKGASVPAAAKVTFVERLPGTGRISLLG